METYTLLTYISDNYVTLLLLSTLAVLLTVNREIKIHGLHYVWSIMLIVLLLTVCEAAEDMCAVYGWDSRFLYFKTAAVYWLYPLTAMLELYLVAPIKHKVVLAIPYAINFILTFIDLFDMRLVYWFTVDGKYQGGALSSLPMIVLLFYVLMLGVYSAVFISTGKRSKGMIVLFIAVSAVVTAVGERQGFAHGHSETVTVIEMLTYCFFLAANDYGKVQSKLYESRIELKQDRIKLLIAQIQPHFIFNSIATIQSLCYTDSEAAADCIDTFGDYLRANISLLSSDEPILFSMELEHIKQYIKLEKAGTDVDFSVKFDLGVTSFRIPSLTVQPIVENAIKHGALTRRDGSGQVTLKTECTDESIVITVTDNGIGAKLTDKQSEHRSVGIENVKKRLAVQCGGTLDVNFTDSGGTAVITVPKTRYGKEEKEE